MSYLWLCLVLYPSWMCAVELTDYSDVKNFDFQFMVHQMLTVWSWLPVRITMYHPEMLDTTEEHRCSMTTFFNLVVQHEPTILIVTMVTKYVMSYYVCATDDFFQFSFCPEGFRSILLHTSGAVVRPACRWTRCGFGRTHDHHRWRVIVILVICRHTHTKTACHYRKGQAIMDRLKSPLRQDGRLSDIH